MYINQKTEQEFQEIKKMSIKTLLELRKELDRNIFDGKAHLVGLDFPIPVHLNSVFLTRNQRKKLETQSKLIISAIFKVADEYYQSEILQEKIQIDKFEKKLFLASPPRKGFGVMRLDAFWDGTGLKFVELNSDFPDGIMIFHAICKAYDNILDKYKIIKKTASRSYDNRNLMLVNMLSYYKTNGGKKKKPVIAVLGPKGRLGGNEYDLTVDYLRKRGYKSFHVEPKDITAGKDKSLWHKDVKIDIIRRAGEIRYFMTKKNCQKIFEAYTKNKVIIFNDFHNRLCGIKSLFSILKEEEFKYLFTKEELRAIKATIPDSFIVPTSKKGIEKEEYWNKKNLYVLKPSDMSEAEDILFGRDFSDEKWRKMLLSKKCSGWIIQELIDIKKRNVVILKNNKKTTKELYSDFSIYVFMDKKGKLIVGGIANRTSDAPIVNVVKGGGVNEIKTSSK